MRRWHFVRARHVGGEWLNSGHLTLNQAELLVEALTVAGMQAQVRELSYRDKRAAA